MAVKNLKREEIPNFLNFWLMQIFVKETVVAFQGVRIWIPNIGFGAFVNFDSLIHTI